MLLKELTDICAREDTLSLCQSLDNRRPHRETKQSSFYCMLFNSMVSISGRSEPQQTTGFDLIVLVTLATF